MVRHIVLWKLKEGVNRNETVSEMRRQLCSLKGKIDGLESVEVGLCSGEWDAALCTIFRDLDSLTLYRTHPEHVKVQGFVHSVISDRTSADYDMQ